MLRRFASLSSCRPTSSRRLQLESLEDRSMLSLPTVVAPDASVPLVAASLESQDLSTDSSNVPAETAQMAPLPASSFTLVGPVDQPAANTSVAAPLPSVTPALADAALTDVALATTELTGVDDLIVPLGSDAENNLPPSVDSFSATYDTLVGIWTFEGSVSDPDDSLVGRTVTFGGVFADYNLSTTVNADNTFSLQWMSDYCPEGFASATVTDPHGASGTFTTWVYIA